MYYIRADANEKIGTGHVMRCLSIAGEFCKHGEEVTFIIADDRSRNIIEEYNYSTICLNSDWNNLDLEVETLIQIIKLHKIEVLLIDSYFVTERYLRALKQYTRLVYLDDLNTFIYPVDVLINYNIYATDFNYKKNYQNAGVETAFILGCSYAPLRDEFSCVRRTTNEKVSRILITSGGTDNYGIMNEILYTLVRKPWFQSVEYEIIMGRFHSDALLNSWNSYPNVHLLMNITNMSKYMSACDIAVTAGGITVYELCACGIPSILYTQADNQLEIAKSMSEKGLTPWVGDIRTDKTKCVEQIIQHMENYRTNRKLREQTSKAMQSEIDGRGCSRLVRRLLEMVGY